MSRRRKDRVKEARANEKERLARKNTEYADNDTRADIQGGQVTNAQNVGERTGDDATATPIRYKDSKGKRIPTESERRSKGLLTPSDDDNSAKDQQRQEVENETSSQIGRKTDKGKAGKRKTNNRGKAGKNRKGKAQIVFWKIASHPFLIALILIFAVIIGVAIYGIAEQNMSKSVDGMAQEDNKTTSLIGLTQPAKKIIEDTGKYDVFWQVPDQEENISYADLFDRTVTASEQKILEERGQTLDEDFAFEYNPDISSAKEAKEAASASTTENVGDENENENQAL